MAKNPNDRFTVYAYYAQVGWEIATENVTRREAWRCVLAHETNTPISVYRIEGDSLVSVWDNDVDEEAAEHSAWLSRTPR